MRGWTERQIASIARVVDSSTDDSLIQIEPLSGFSPGRFIDVRDAGRGRNSVVFHAWDAHLERPVVFKTSIPPQMRPEELDRVEDELQLEGALKAHADDLRAEYVLARRYTAQREGQLLAKIRHPNVVPVLDVGELHNGNDAVILAYLGGGTLADREMPERWQDVLDIVLQIGRGLAALHAKGILHRDLKPNNVVFDDEGRPMIVDLGLACQVEDEEAMADWVGSLLYMSPEVVDREHRDARDDLYAFSVVAFECFYATLPFASWEDRGAGRVKAVTRARGMSRAIHDVLVRGLAADRETRWPDVETMLRALEAARSGSRSPEGPSVRAPWARVLLASTLAALIAVALVRFPHPRPASLSAIQHTTTALDTARRWPFGLGLYLGAFLAVEDADLQRAYNLWSHASSTVKFHAPHLAGELSMVLARRWEQVAPGRLSAAWIAETAAESFELAGSWPRAVEARAAAAALFRAAIDGAQARRQDRCADLNRRGQRC